MNTRYPLLIKLLARFSDSRGVPMAEQWLSDTDKKRLKELRKARAQREAETATFGDPAVALKLRSSIPARAGATLDRCIDARINPMTASLDALQRVSAPMNSALAALKVAPQHRDTLTAAIASSASLSASTAKVETSALLTLLKRCGRIAENNNIVEIK